MSAAELGGFQSYILDAKERAWYPGRTYYEYCKLLRFCLHWRKEERQEGKEAGERGGFCRGLGLKGVNQHHRPSEAYRLPITTICRGPNFGPALRVDFWDMMHKATLRYLLNCRFGDPTPRIITQQILWDQWEGTEVEGRVQRWRGGCLLGNSKWGSHAVVFWARRGDPSRPFAIWKLLSFPPKARLYTKPSPHVAFSQPHREMALSQERRRKTFTESSCRPICVM